MKIKHIKTTLVLIILLLMIMIPFINFSAYRIKNYISKFEEVNQYIIENKLASKNTLSLITNKRTPDFPILDEAIHKSKLYSINYYTNKGIVYMFKHKNTNKFYLIKCLNKNKELLSFEQYIDYSKPTIKLENSWYLIEQSIEYN
jgi:hypothetical protein